MTQKYKKPPIVEAIIEIRFSEPLTQKLLDKAKKLFAKDYPFCEDINNVGVHIDAINKSAHYKEEPIAYKMTSKETADAIIISAHTFTISRLAPYLGWQSIKERLEQNLQIWEKEIGTRKIQRIGVRYINRIDVPSKKGQKFKFENYLKFYPYLPDDKLLNMSQYTMQSVIPVTNEDITIIINSAIIPSPLLEHASLIFDIDVSKSDNLPQRKEDIFIIIEKMREHKNYIFESLITEKSKELFSK